MEITNSLASRKNGGKMKFSKAIQTPAYQQLINSAISDEKKRQRFVTDVLATVSSNEMLKRCDAATVLSSALQGVSLDLSSTLGEYWLVPYRVGKPDFEHPENETYHAQFQLGVAGRVQLAMRSGQYADLDTLEIRQGEYKGRDKKTGKPVFEFVEDEEKREELPIIGYLAWFELLNGFRHSVYFSKEKVLRWADRYSKAFSRDLYERYIAGKITDWKEKQKCSSPWYERFDSMAENTVLKQCLKRGPKSIEMRTAEMAEEKAEIEANAAVSETFSEESPEDNFFEGTETAQIEDIPEPIETPKAASKKRTTKNEVVSHEDGQG